MTCFLWMGPVHAAKSSSLSCPVLHPIAQGYLAHHILYRQLGEELENRTIDQFIEKLDPSKVYLLSEDIDKIRASLKGIFKKFGQDCAAIEASHKILTKRLVDSLIYVKTFLDQNYKFVENTELLIDPKLRKWSSSQKEAHSQLQKFIHFQISNYLATDMKLPQAKKQLFHRYELNLKRQKELSKDELYSLFLDSFANSLDAHSSYLSRDTLEDFEISMRLSLEGIGAALTWEDGYTTVDALIPGGSAERSNEIQPKDKIIAVAQGSSAFESVIDMPLREVVRLIRGKKGTSVRLTILREGPKQTTRLIVALVRDKINLQDEAARLVITKKKEGDREIKLGVIDLPSFYGDLTKRTRSCYDDLKKLLEQARKEKVDGIILDFSKNGGGLLSEAVRIAGLFIQKGNIVATQDSKQKLDLLPDTDSKVSWQGPLIILTSRLSASASEIVAGALQDYKRAVIVGADYTFGKGTVQAMMNLPSEMGAIKVTTGMFFVPGGKSTQTQGVGADVVLPSIFSTKDTGEKSLDHALPPRSISSFLSEEANSSSLESHWNPVTKDQIQKLKQLSSIRVEKNEEFKKIKQEVAELEIKKGVINLSESLKKQKEEKKKEDKNALTKSSKSNRRRQSDEDYLKQPYLQEGAAVLADLVTMAFPPVQQTASH